MQVHETKLSEAISQPVKINGYINLGDIYLHVDSFHYRAGPIDPNSEHLTERWGDRLRLIGRAIEENTDGFTLIQDDRCVAIPGGMRKSECVAMTYERPWTGKEVMTVLLPPDHPLAVRWKGWEVGRAEMEARWAERRAAKRAKAAARRAEKAQLAEAA